jgi:CheY-like chemotaxis protein
MHPSTANYPDIAGPPNSSPSVLVVDDDTSMTFTLSRILEFKGYLPQIAHSGTEALERLAHTNCDCVLSDIRMPNTDGVEFCREVHSRHPNLPVVLMTAYAEDEMIERALAEGAIEVLTKPLDIDALLFRINRLCARA